MTTSRRGRFRAMVGVTVVLAMAGALAVLGAPAVPTAADEGDGLTWTAVDVGATFACAIDTADAASCWGYNSYGNLGNGEMSGDVATPGPVQAPPGVSWSSLTTGLDHACGVSTEDEAYCWGMQFFGRLGNGTTDFGWVTAPVPVVTPDGVAWSTLSAGDEHTCGLSTEGAAYCWGSANDGKLGNGVTSGNVGTPQAVSTPAGVAWDSISAFRNHTCALTTTGAAYCWGANANGEVGDGTMTATVSVPTQVSTALVSTWSSVEVGYSHTCGVSAAGAAYCWGWAGGGRMGDGNSPWAGQPTPLAVAVPPGVTGWEVVSPGSPHTCGLTTGGQIYCWGQQGLLGDGTTNQSNLPVAVDTPPGVEWTSVSAGVSHTCALAVGGNAYCWGYGTFGQIGDGERQDRLSPTLVGPPPPANAAPVADAGADRVVNLGDEVVLDGSGSSDADEDELSFSWAQTGGDEVELSGADTAQATFTAPEGPATLVFELTVDDGQGGSDSDQVTITVNGAPIAHLAEGLRVNEGTTMILDATGSTDPDGDELTATWRQVSGPEVEIEDTEGALFTRFVMPAPPAVLVFEVLVEDGRGGSDTAQATFTANWPPVADAGGDRIVVEGDEVTLDGSGSSDPDEDELLFTWGQTGGPEVELSGADTATPTFTAPAAPATLSFSLTVDDDHGAMGVDTDTVTVTVVPRFTADETWVDHAYRALLGRGVDEGALDHWAGRLDAGESRTHVARLIGRSPEALSGRVLDQRYKGFLHRSADPGGRAHWAARLQAGQPLVDLELDLLSSAELFGQGGSNAGYVGLLYERLLGREADAAGRAHWAGQLDRGVSRRSVAATFLAQPETHQRRVAAAYLEMLGRQADPGGQAHWADQLSRTRDLLGVETSLVAAWNPPAR